MSLSTEMEQESNARECVSTDIVKDSKAYDIGGGDIEKHLSSIIGGDREIEQENPSNKVMEDEGKNEGHELQEELPLHVAILLKVTQRLQENLP